jgi:hypothetical protein
LIVVLFLLVQAFVPVSQLWKLQLPTNLPKIESPLELLSSKNRVTFRTAILQEWIHTPEQNSKKNREEGIFFRAITLNPKHPKPSTLEGGRNLFQSHHPKP